VSDETPAIDFSALTADDVPASAPEFGVPDFKASEAEKKARKVSDLFKPAGDRANDKGKPAAKARKKAVPRRKGQFVEPLTQMYAMVGAVAMPFDPVCANAVITSAQQCAESLDELAYQNEAVRRALYSLTQTSAIGAVMVAHAPIAIAVMMHHNNAAQKFLGNMGAQFADNVEDQMKGGAES
jgi:hypothetical protein